MTLALNVEVSNVGTDASTPSTATSPPCAKTKTSTDDAHNAGDGDTTKPRSTCCSTCDSGSWTGATLQHVRTERGGLMITVRVTREWNYATSETCIDTYELEHDEDGYNPSTVRDMRDVVMSMMPDTDDEQELTTIEEMDDRPGS